MGKLHTESLRKYRQRILGGYKFVRNAVEKRVRELISRAVFRRELFDLDAFMGSRSRRQRQLLRRWKKKVAHQ